MTKPLTNEYGVKIPRSVDYAFTKPEGSIPLDPYCFEECETEEDVKRVVREIVDQHALENAAAQVKYITY